MGCQKGKSSTMLYEQFGEVKYKYQNREVWWRGYCVDTAGKNTRRIQEYIQNQLKEDEKGEQLTMQPKIPFAGGKQQQNAAGRPYLRVNVCAKNRGLCPHLKSPRLRRGMIIAACAEGSKHFPQLHAAPPKAVPPSGFRRVCISAFFCVFFGSQQLQRLYGICLVGERAHCGTQKLGLRRRRCSICHPGALCGKCCP